ncbi:MAG: hypothetical protein H7A36_03340 [Chlamydiales bacterium]|nr:hypothetical protein [Chlamydiales bacterium]
MKMENLSIKDKLRAQCKAARKSVLCRRQEASHTLFVTLLPKLIVPTLSFSSFKEEIDMTLINEYLENKGLLLLPKVVGQELEIGGSPQLILVPGLAFSPSGHRLGYGGGYYDRLLATLFCETIGVGFKEQLVEELPVEPHDVPLTALHLV